MSAIHIFQIYYSTSTRDGLDPGFIPLDNLANERPDWREYWPIRKYLLGNTLVDGDYYGFLSPAFHSKTGLDARAVIDFVNAQRGEPDVIMFSPYYDQIAFFLNQWEQGAMSHRSAPVFEESVRLVAPEFSMYDTATCMHDSVYCNYFVAKAAFWQMWFERCERVFDCAERGDSDLGRALCACMDYKSQSTPAKVFIIERVVSALLATQTRWVAKPYNSMLLPFSDSPISTLAVELAALDALKIAFRVDPCQMYKKSFFRLRARFAERRAQP